MTALLWICFFLLGLTNPAIARRPRGATQPDGPVEEIHLRSNYFAADRQQKPLLVAHVRRSALDGKVEKRTEKLVPIDHDELVDDDVVEAIAAERKLQMTTAEGIKRTYKMPNKNYNNKKKGSSSSSKKKSSSSSSSIKKKKKKSTSTTDTKSTHKSRSQRKRKKSLFKKESKSKKKSDKKTKDSSSKSKSKSRSGDQTCKSKAHVECRDDCIASNCGFDNDKMCIRKCKQDCCVDNETGNDSDDRNEPTAAPVASGGGGPAPEPTTLQPAAPVAITPAPSVALPVMAAF